MQQAVGTIAGTLYHIDFFLTQNGFSSGGSINVQFGGTIGYSAIDSTLPRTPTYAEFSFDSLATSGSTLFSFNITAYGGGTTWINNVSVVPVASGIPEPASVALFGIGLMGLGFGAYRRKGVAAS